MKKFRIVELETGSFRVEYFESNFFENPLRQWNSWNVDGYKTLEQAENIYKYEIDERDHKRLRHNITKIIRSEELK